VGKKVKEWIRRIKRVGSSNGRVNPDFSMLMATLVALYDQTAMF
jgi:hypothetical protein